jgi:hypothetical protein
LRLVGLVGLVVEKSLELQSSPPLPPLFLHVDVDFSRVLALCCI